MIPSYSRYDLRMNVCGSKYFLPFESFDNVKDDEILEKTIKFLSDLSFYEKKLYEENVDKTSISVRNVNEIVINCLYEGYCEYYRFSVVLNVFRLKDEEGKHNNKWMFAFSIEQEDGDLLDELIDRVSTPRIISEMKLVKYSYFD